MSVVVRHVVYPGLSWNRDEATYLWQVRALRAGDLLTTASATPQFFQPWLTGLRGGQFFSQYTLGWPGVMLVADVLFGSPVMSMVWGTMLAVLGTYVFTREVTRNHTLAVVTSVLMLASPMVITQSGVYLGYPLLAGRRAPVRQCVARRLAQATVVVAPRRRRAARHPLHHASLRRRALGRGDGRVRRLHHVATVESAVPGGRARVRRDPPVLRAHTGAEQDRDRQASPSSRSRPRNRSTSSASASGSSCRSTAASTTRWSKR